MAVIFKNTDIITWDKYIKNTDVSVEGNKIKKIGNILDIKLTEANTVDLMVKCDEIQSKKNMKKFLSHRH